jgi:glutamate racemase
LLCCREEATLLSASAPIGLYDSGLGGLSVAREVFRQLPHESIRYFGDTARVPYGGRSESELLAFNREILSHLLASEVKAVVVACNTSSAIALPQLAPQCPVPIVGLIEAGARAAVANGRRIGVIATEATIRSGAHLKAIEAIAPDCQVFPLGCPAFVPLIEAGNWEGEEVEATVFESLRPFFDVPLDALVLGCTHFPFLGRVISEVLGEGIRLVDPAEEAIASLRAILTQHGLLGNDPAPIHQGLVSGDPDEFAVSAQRFLGDVFATVERVEVTDPLSVPI